VAAFNPTGRPKRGISEKTEKPKDRKYVFMRLGQYLYKHKFLLMCAVILTIVSNIFALIGPQLSGYAIDAIELGTGKVDFDRVFYYAGLMIIFYVVSALLSYILAVLMINISQKIVFQMRKDVFKKLTELPVGYFDKFQTGDIISKFSYDIDTINTSLSNDLVQICASLITIVGSFAMMIKISPLLVLIFVFTIPLSIFLTKYMTGKTRPLFRTRSAKLGVLNGFVEEMVSGQKTLKAYNQEENTIKKFDIKNEEAVEAYYRAEYFGSMVGPSVNFINNLSLSLISIFGAILYLKNLITLGNISSFVLYSRKFSGPINEAANIMSELQSAAAAAERVFQLIDELPETGDLPNSKVLNTVYGDVELKEVSFGYIPEKEVIHNLSLKAKKGSLTAIVGPTGSGKTTIINLLMRFYDVTSGGVYVDDTNIKNITRKSLRQAYAMVLQDTWLFNGTIFENIAYGKEDATMEDVIEAAKAAKIHSYIKRLPDGYNTVIGEGGASLSGGEKQRISIARAMLKNAPIVILDEATANVDPENEDRLQKAIEALTRNKTIIMIAHRLKTVRHADRILVIDHGRIVQQGKHEELIAEPGIYADFIGGKKQTVDWKL